MAHHPSTLAIRPVATRLLNFAEIKPGRPYDLRKGNGFPTGRGQDLQLVVIIRVWRSIRITAISVREYD